MMLVHTIYHMEKILDKNEAERLMEEWFKAPQSVKIKTWCALVPYINAYKDLWREKKEKYRPKVNSTTSESIKSAKKKATK